MNKVSKHIILFFIFLSCLSCSDQNAWNKGTFIPSLKANFIYFPKNLIELGGNENTCKTVNLQSISNTWKFDNPAPEWLTISPMEGKGDAIISFAAKENPSSDNIRTAVVKLQSTDQEYAYSKMFTVNQGKAASILDSDTNDMKLTRNSQRKTITITANTNWKATCNENWVHLTKSSDSSLIVDIDENNDNTERNAIIVISGSSVYEIHVTQSGITITPSQTNIEFSRESQTKTVNISANYNWTASCASTWIHLVSSPSNGLLSITVDENNGIDDRSDNIILHEGISSISVTQHGYKFDDLVSVLDFGAASTTKTANIQTDGTWTAKTNESWINISPKSGYGNGIISVKAEHNEGTEQRIGNIAITVGEVTKYISIQQNGAYFDISSSSDSEIPASGGTRTITFSTSEEWIVECGNSSWVSVDKSYGSPGTNTISITFSKNELETSRTDYTYIRTNNSNFQDFMITTVQKGIPYSYGHEYIDLGLPSGTLWATMNIGASSPEDCGDYFAWGETTGYYGGKTIFDLDSYKWYDGNKLTKYSVSEKTRLELSDDVAYQSWGGYWRIPSTEQIEELFSECQITKTKQNGVNGVIITSNANGQSLFFPETGERVGKGMYGGYGAYWSNTLCWGDDRNKFYAMIFSIYSRDSNIMSYRPSGLCVRPVLKK